MMVQYASQYLKEKILEIHHIFYMTLLLITVKKAENNLFEGQKILKAYVRKTKSNEYIFENY